MKDPAILFYSGDFITGTQFFTDEQTGKYIRLLCAQHLHGHLSEKHMLMICKTYDEDVYKKFDKDEYGLFYNKVLDFHIEKRKNYAESRRNNRLNYSKKAVNEAITKPLEGEKDVLNTSITYVNHMVNENVNENVIVNKEVKENKIETNFKKTIKRFEKFKADVLLFETDYGVDMLNAFINHWGEMTKSKDKMLFEIKDTFEINRRLVTWNKNNAKFDPAPTGRIKPGPASASKLDNAEDRHNDALKHFENE